MSAKKKDERARIWSLLWACLYDVSYKPYGNSESGRFIWIRAARYGRERQQLYDDRLDQADLALLKENAADLWSLPALYSNRENDHYDSSAWFFRMN